MVPKLYKLDGSPPVRSVYLTSKALGITLDYIEIDLLKKEHLTSDFLKMNPQHTVPTLVDDDKVIWDSHAINTYLIRKYGKEDDPLYPNDLFIRARIDQRLHFDSGILFALLRLILRPIVYRGEKIISKAYIDDVNDGYNFLNTFLEGHDWAAGDNLTLADLSLIPTVTSLNTIIPMDDKKHCNVIAWIKRAEKLPYYYVNQQGLEQFDAAIQGRLKS